MEHQEKIRYYLVTAKCGHVGRYKYIEINFPVYASSAREAAQITLQKPKVKRQLKNAISDVREITQEEFYCQREEHYKNNYVKSHTKKEIIDYFEEAEFLGRITKKHKKSFRSRFERVQFLMRKYSSRGLI